MSLSYNVAHSVCDARDDDNNKSHDNRRCSDEYDAQERNGDEELHLFTLHYRQYRIAVIDGIGRPTLGGVIILECLDKDFTLVLVDFDDVAHLFDSSSKDVDRLLPCTIEYNCYD